MGHFWSPEKGVYKHPQKTQAAKGASEDIWTECSNRSSLSHWGMARYHKDGMIGRRIQQYTVTEIQGQQYGINFSSLKNLINRQIFSSL